MAHPSILLVCPCSEATGNRTTALRYATIFMQSNLEVVLEDPSEVDETKLLKLLQQNNIVLIVVVHVTKGAVILDSLVVLKVPIVIVLGGTDVNIDAHKDPELFCRRVSRAHAVVGFTQSLFDAAPVGAFPSTVLRYIIPQGVNILKDPLQQNINSNLIESRSDGGGEPHVDSSILDAVYADLADCPFFLLVASIRPVKDLLYLCDAVIKLRAVLERRRVNVIDSASSSIAAESYDSPLPCLVIIGPVLDDEYHIQVVEKIATSGGALKLYPSMSQSSVNMLSKRSLAVVNSSVSEGQSSALLEAMALGVPVMARDIPGNKKSLSGVNDILSDCFKAYPEEEKVVRKSDSDDIKSKQQQQHSLNTNDLKESFTHRGSPSLKTERVNAELENGREQPEWQLLPNGILFSSPNGFYEAALNVYFSQDVDLKLQLDEAVDRAKRGVSAQTDLELSRWSELLATALK